MRCDICENTNTYIKDYHHEYIIKGKEINFIAPRRFCKNCDNLVYDAELDNQASEIAISLYNKKYGISKEEIINLRKRYNLSQDLFSKVIGCAKKTLISYEKGKSIPNDSYLIIIKSLVSKPDTILTLIEANKEQFTNKEFAKIHSKLVLLLPNNAKNLVLANDELLNEYNGYTKFSKEKIYNIILFLADKTILKTKLLKEMFYVDFLCYKNTCKSMTGLEYSKLPFGPVPDQFESILTQSANDKIISYDVVYNNDYECHNISGKKTFDNTLFTNEELEILTKVKIKFSKLGSKDIVDYSHQEKAFTETKFYKKISYDYAFDINLD